MIRYVERLPRPMPSNIKYCSNDGNAPIAMNGTAQQIPFIALIFGDHFRLFFILCRIRGSILPSFLKFRPVTAPKLPNQTIP